MKVLFLTAGPDITASSRTRVYKILPRLHRAGIETSVIPSVSRKDAEKIANVIQKRPIEKIFGKIFGVFSILKFLILAKRFDILFIQKILLPQKLIDIIRALNNNIIFDFDAAPSGSRIVRLVRLATGSIPHAVYPRV